jgi:predicted transcriptional regulator
MADETKMTIRLSPDLHERLKQAAERDHRSMHAQMTAYIERGLTQDDRKEKRTTK